MSLTRRVVAFCVLVLATCTLAAADHHENATADDEAAIHAVNASWSAASQAKDADGFAAVYADDAVLMLEGAPDIAGREALHAAISGMMQDPNFELWFEADQVVVAASGDMAYETGSYRMTMSDPEGNPATLPGHYVVVWRKQADGSWKVVLDVPVSDPPEGAPAHDH